MSLEEETCPIKSSSALADESFLCEKPSTDEELLPHNTQLQTSKRRPQDFELCIAPKSKDPTDKAMSRNLKIEQASEVHNQKTSSFSWTDFRNLTLQILCYACLMSSATMLIGTNAIIIISLGASNEISPIPNAIFFIASSFVSLATIRLFQSGRKRGFLIGNACGFIGAIMGGLAIWMRSPAIMLLANLPLGMSFGIGNYLRFAAVEVVQPSKKSLAVTLVLTGGVVAAFVGPESAQATKNSFGADFQYLGTFMMIAIFNTVMGLLQSMILYPTNAKMEVAEGGANRAESNSFIALLAKRQVLYPALTASFSWAIMAVPMTIVRVTMGQLGYSSRQSLLTVEFHFLGMFAPGFVSGSIIERTGEFFTALLGIVFFIAATACNFASSSDGSVATWMLGLTLAGVGWNLVFSSSTIMLIRAYESEPEMKNTIQAVHDFLMFFLAGAFIVSSGYVYTAAGSGWGGWHAINFLTAALVILMGGLVVAQMPSSSDEIKDRNSSSTEEEVL